MEFKFILYTKVLVNGWFESWYEHDEVVEEHISSFTLPNVDFAFLDRDGTELHWCAL